MEIARVGWQFVESVLEDCAELEPDENLSAEDENARLVQRRLHLLAEFHEPRPILCADVANARSPRNAMQPAAEQTRRSCGPRRSPLKRTRNWHQCISVLFDQREQLRSR